MSSKLETFENFVENYAKQPGQGLKLCKKKLQKDPNNLIFLLAQAAFLSELGRPQDAIASCDAIRASPKDPLEPGVIIALQNILKACQKELSTYTGVAGPRINGFWKDALDRCPKSWLKETRTEMLTSALRLGYWDLAQQLFLRLQKENPQNPKFHFAWIQLCQYQAEKLPDGDKTAESLKMLAYRSIKAAIDNTVARKDTPRKITSAAELRLIIEVYTEQSKYDELLEVLEDPNIGIQSEVGKHDVEFVRAKAALLKKTNRWADLAKFYASGLQELFEFLEREGSTVASLPNSLAWTNNYEVWNSVLSIYDAEPDLKTPIEVYELSQKFANLDSKYRNAARARVAHAHVFDRENLLVLCQDFFAAFRRKAFCYGDLRGAVPRLNNDEQAKLLGYLYTTVGEQPSKDSGEKSIVDWMTSAVNALKLTNQMQQDEHEKLQLVIRCLKIYATTDNREDDPADEAIVLAVCILIRLSNSECNEWSMRAAILARLLRERSPRHYAAKLLEVLSYRTLGLGTLTITASNSLDIKGIQWESLGYLVFTRLCCLQPFALKDKTDPKKLIETAMGVPKTSSDSTLNTICKDLEDVHFEKFDDFLLYERSVSSSYSLFYLPLELQRIRRLTGETNIPYSLPKEFDFEYVDNRDYGVIPNFEEDDVKFASLATGGWKPRGYWAARWQLHELVSVLLSLKPSTLTESQSHIVDQLFAYLKHHGSEEQEEINPREAEVMPAWSLLVPLVFFLILGPKNSHSSKDSKKDLKALIEVLQNGALVIRTEALKLEDNDFVFTSRLPLEKWYLYLEVAQVCATFVNSATAALKQKSHHASGSIPTSDLGNLKSEAKGLAETIQKSAKAFKERLSKNGKKMIIDAVAAGDLGREIKGLVGEETLSRYADDFVASAVDSLDGVLKVKVAQ